VGLFDFLKDEPAPKKVEQRPAAKKLPVREALSAASGEKYFVDEMPLGSLGLLVAVDRNFLIVKKAEPQKIEDAEVSIAISRKQYSAAIVSQDNAYLTLRIGGEFEDPDFVKKNARKVSDAVLRPKGRLADEVILRYIENNILTTLLNLMAEIGSTSTNLQRLKMYIMKLPGLKEKVAEKAGTFEEEKPVMERDVDFAIRLLGLVPLKEVSLEYIRTVISREEPALTNFKDLECFKVLKAVMMSELGPFFGFKDDNGLGGTLISLETVGIDIMCVKRDKSLTDYYTTPSRIYSEMSRFLERTRLSHDLPYIDKFYLLNTIKSLVGYTDGYILAHLILNPHYRLDPAIKVSLSKINLSYAFTVYLTFLAGKFIVERDRESGYVLMRRLRRTGMDEEKLRHFMERCLKETNTIIKDLGMIGSVKGATASPSAAIRTYLPKETEYEALIKSFMDFQKPDMRRMALRYEDDDYTHYILGKILEASDMGLSEKVYCVVPCENLDQVEFYVELFSYFHLVVFKNIDKLPKNLIRDFTKIWNEFDGQIIVTYSKYDFIDLDKRDLFAFLKRYVVDFPSYFENPKIYANMVQHTMDYVKPYLPDRSSDPAKYLEGIYTMNYIKIKESAESPLLSIGDEEASDAPRGPRSRFKL
jgi:hypothetical protein